jgi:hypothetical protein
MNGLTASDVSQLSNALFKSIEKLFERGEDLAAKELQGMLNVIEIMQQQNATTQPSRPDRVGDECWYALWDVDNGRWDWRRGVLRSWVAGDNPAAVEDIQTGWIEYKSNISFASEAPK